MQLTEAPRAAAPPAVAPFVPLPGGFSAGVVASMLSGGATFDQQVAIEKQRTAAVQREQRDRNRDEERARSEEAAAAAAAPTTAEVAQQAERSMAPGSRAARDAARREQQQHAAQAARPPAPACAAESGTAPQEGRLAQSADRRPETEKTTTAPVRSNVAAPLEALRAMPPAASSNPAPQAELPPPEQPGATTPGVAAPLSATSAPASRTAVSPPQPGASPAMNAISPAAAVESSTAPKSEGGVVRHDSPGTQAGASSPERAKGVSRGGDPQAPRNAEAHENTNVERIVRELRTRITQDRASASLRLDPPELGQIRMRMELEGDQMRLLIETQTHLAHHVLRETLDGLRAELAACGIQLAEVELRAPQPLPDDGSSGGFEGASGHETGASADQRATQDGAPAEDFGGAADPAPDATAPAAPPAAGEDALPPAAIQPVRDAAEPRVNVWA